MKFCSNCSNPIEQTIPEGDNRLRFVCTPCDRIYYQNPRVIAGCLPVYGDEVLLCRRAIEPRKGYWTLPAGFLENGETTTDGALRETIEEANAEVTIENLYTVFSLPHISQIYMFFRAELPEPKFSAGVESLEVALFKEQEIPWDELSFPVITDTLKHFFDDRKTGQFPTRYANIEPTNRPNPLKKR